MSFESTVFGVRVGYEKYIFAHRKSPAGRGEWAFYFNNESEPHFYNGLFSQVKKEAARDAKANNCYNIQVGA